MIDAAELQPVTRAYKRKCNLVWAKTAPIHAPNFLALKYSRYVPAPHGPPGGPWPVYDRKLAKTLTPKELVRVSDDDLRFEKFGVH